MSQTHPFKPIFDKNSKILILGSFPSVVSRKFGFYYANPQNRFWRVLAQILNAPPAKTVLYKPFDGPSPSDQIRFLDHDAMVENLADEILKAETLSQNL